MQGQCEVHLIKMCLLLKKVTISVRFPCSISFALKHQNTIVQHKGIHELRKGECNINQSIEMHLQLTSRGGTYDQKKVSLLIYMISANGKIPAGSVTIIPTERVIVDRRAPLEKCPDKNAEATYTQNFQLVEVLAKTVNPHKLNLDSFAQLGAELFGSKIKYSSSSKNLFPAEEGQYPKESVRTQMREPRDVENRLYSSKHQRSSKDLRYSQMGERKGSRARLTRYEQLSKKSVATLERESRESYELNASRVSSQLLQAQEDPQHPKIKIAILEQEKANYLKKLSKVRDSLVRVDSEQRVQLQEQIQKAKYENESLQDEMQVLKQKTKYQQKRERQSSSAMKQLKDQLDRKKSKILQLDNSRVKFESELGEKDKAVYQLQNEKKKLQDQLEEQKALVLSSQKRLELKENSYKEQLKKLNEKYAQSEIQRQKAVLDYNNILAEIQTSEKRNQLALRDKEKSLIEQKVRLTKRIQQLNSEVIISNQRLGELKLAVDEHQLFKKKVAEMNAQREEKITQLHQENQLLLNEIRSCEENYKKVTEEKARLQQLFSQDKVNYKKKYTESQSQIASFKDKLQKALKVNVSLEAKLHELENQIQLQVKEKNGFATKLQQYKKQVAKFLNQEENRQRLAETLSMQTITQNHKISEFKSKLDAERKKFEQMENQYEEQVKYLVKSKEMVESQIEQLRWMLEKEAEKYQIVTAKNKELNEQINQLSHKIIQLQEKETSYMHQNEAKKQLINTLNSQLSNLGQKQKITAQKFKEKEQVCYGFQKEIQNYKQQLYILTQNHQKTIKTLEEKAQRLEKLQQKTLAKLKQKDDQTTNLKEELYSTKNLISKQKQQLQSKSKELQTAKESCKAINADYSSLISRSDNLKSEEQKKARRIQELQIALNQEKNQKERFIREVQRKTMDFQDYRTNTIKSLEQFFNLLNKQQADVRRQSLLFITLPEQQLSLLQIQALKKRNILVSKSQEEIAELSNKIRLLQGDKKRQERLIAELEEHHQNAIKKEQEKCKLLQEENVRQFDEFSQKMNNLAKNEDERSNQIQYFNIQAKRYQALIEELSQVINRLRVDQTQLKSQVVKLENQVFRFKQKEIKEKLLSSTETDELKHIIQVEQQRLKELLQSHKEELRNKDKQIADKTEQIKKWAAREEEWKIELRKNLDKMRQLELKMQTQLNSKDNLKEQLRQKQAKIKANQEERLLLKFNIQQLKLKEIVLQQESKRSKAQIEILQQKYKSSKVELQNKYQNTIENEKRERDKREKVESFKAKIQQQNKQSRQKCVKLESQIEFYKFYKLESAKKIEQLQRYKAETMAELVKYRESTLKSQKQIGNFENKYYKLEVEMESLLKQKSILSEDNLSLKQKLKEQEQRLLEYQAAYTQLDSREKEILRLNNAIKSNEEQFEKMTTDLKISLTKYKQTLNEKVNKIKQLQKFMEQKYNDLTDQRVRWQKQHQTEKSSMQMRILQLQDKYQMIQEEFEFQKMQAIREIESTNGVIQELNEVIRNKEEDIQHKDEIINEQVVRLEQLNIQLNECVNKWETEKQAYLPTETKMAELNEELSRMNKFISELDGRNKQLLEINKRKMQQNVVSKPSITEQLKEVYVLLQKNKNRILNRCQTEKEKEIVISQFKAVMEKLDLTLKSTQIVVPKP